METSKEYHYTYYSYEEYGRGYIGSRTCKCLPEKDVRYFGSFKDKTFKPTQKIIIKGDYNTREEADVDEVVLHNYFEVDINPHFANRARQTSSKFRLPKEKSVEMGRINGKKNHKNKVGIFSRTREELVETGRKSGQKNYELGIGIHGLTKEQMSENNRRAGKMGGRKGGKKSYELSLGLFAISKEERKEASRKADETNKKNGTGIYGIKREKRVITGKKSAEKVNS